METEVLWNDYSVVLGMAFPHYTATRLQTNMYPESLVGILVSLDVCYE